MDVIEYKGWRLRRFRRPLPAQLTAAHFAKGATYVPEEIEVTTEEVIEAIWLGQWPGRSIYGPFPAGAQMNDAIYECRARWGKPPSYLAVLPKSGSEWAGVPIV